MNAYYKEIEVGFNLWYIYVLLAIVAMIVYGARQYRLVDDDEKFKRFYDESRLIHITIGLSAGFMVLAFLESIRGAAQLVGNILSTDEPFLIYFLGSLMIMFSAAVFGIVLYYIAVVSGWAKVGYLYEKLEENRYWADDEDLVNSTYVSPRV